MLVPFSLKTACAMREEIGAKIDVKFIHPRHKIRMAGHNVNLMGLGVLHELLIRERPSDREAFLSVGHNPLCAGPWPPTGVGNDISTTRKWADAPQGLPG